MTKRRIVHSILLWALAICVIIVIFSMSADDSKSSAGLSEKITRIVAKLLIQNFDKMDALEQALCIARLHGTIRTAAHFIEYLALGLFLCCAMGYCGIRFYPLVTMSSGVLCAIVDENFQRIIPGRAYELKDIFIDSLGVLAGVLIGVIAVYLYRKIKAKTIIKTTDARKAFIRSYLGKIVHIRMDRPIGTVHPKHSSIVYPINYGYIPGVVSGDGEELDVYLLGVNTPQKSAKARIIAIAHRENDFEDKLVAAPYPLRYTAEEIVQEIHFQEQFYKTEIEVMDYEKCR